MTHSSKIKGNTYERELVNQAKESGLEAKRAYASDGRSLGLHEEVIEKLKRIQQLESQLAELREAVWELVDYVDLPPSDYRTDEMDQAWDLLLKTYRDVQKETESETQDSRGRR